MGKINLERSGINESWSEGRKQMLKNASGWIARLDPKNQAKLLDYVKTGVPKAAFNDPVPAVQPPFEVWSRHLPNFLSMYAAMRLHEWESANFDGGRFQTRQAAQVFAAGYLGEMINLDAVYLFPCRFGGKRMKVYWIADILYAALGVVIGCRREGERLFRLYLRLLRRDGYDGSMLGWAPSKSFVLRLAADFLGEAPVPVLDRAAFFPSYLELAERWRDPNPDALHSLCMTVCDLHTQHFTKQEDGESGDFDNFSWSYTPIEILFLFKLRQLLGLQNPVLDHPLMQGPFASLPEETAFAYDELIAAVHTRMVEQGFSDERIAARILNDELDAAGRLRKADEQAAREKEALGEFGRLELKNFFSPGIGLLFSAPSHWVDLSTDKHFQVVDPETGTQFTASAYENPGIDLDEWVVARLGAVSGMMPYLSGIEASKPLVGQGWKGVVTTYRGRFPDKQHESIYVVLCLRTDKLLVSFTVTSEAGAFEKHKDLYTWLMSEKLSLVNLQSMPE